MTLKTAVDGLLAAVDRYNHRGDACATDTMVADVLVAACRLAPHLRKPQTDPLDGFDMADYLGTGQKATLIEEL